MAGRIVRALERTKYEYTGLANGQAVAIKLADIDISGAREATLLVRVHESDITGTGNNFSVIALASAPTNEDPSQDFYQATPVAVASIPETSNFPAPALVLGAVAANAGAWITIFLRPDKVATGSLEATLSIDVSLKD